MKKLKTQHQDFSVVGALFRCKHCLCVATKTFRVLRGASIFLYFLGFLYHLKHVDVDHVCKPNM